MIKACIFDLDGTLADTLADLGYSCNQVLKKHGLPENEVEEYKQKIGNGAARLIEQAVPEEYRNDKKLLTQILKEFDEVYQENIVVRTKLYTGVEEMLASLAGEGVTLGVLSNKPEHFVRPIMEIIAPGIHFDFHMGNSHKFPRKPSPDALLWIIGNLGISRDECLYIGDSNVDVYTSANAGVGCIGAAWGFRGKPELEEAGADYIADTPADVYRIVQKLNQLQ